MAIDFPNSPTTNDVYTAGGRTWIYDGEKWAIQSVPTNATVDSLSDVTVTSPTSGDLLKYDGSAWVNASADAATSSEAGTLYGVTNDLADNAFYMYSGGVYTYTWTASTKTITFSAPLSTVFSSPNVMTQDKIPPGIAVTLFGEYPMSIYGGQVLSSTSNSIVFASNAQGMYPGSDISATVFSGQVMTGAVNANTYVGKSAGASSFGSRLNVAVGYKAMETATGNAQNEASKNVAIGPYVLRNTNNSFNNIIIGTGDDSSTPVTKENLINNIAIGQYAGYDLPNDTYGALIIGPNYGATVANYETVITNGGGTDVFKANNNGAVTLPGQPYMQARGSGGAWLNAGGTNTLRNGVPGGFSWVVSRNVGNHFSASTGAFTAPVTGVYQCVFSTYQSTGGAGVFTHWVWGVGGSLTWNSGQTPYNIYGYAGGGYSDGVNVMHNIYVTAGNAITMNSIQVNGSSFYSDYTYLSIRLLG